MLQICIKAQHIESVYAPIQDKKLTRIPAKYFKLSCPDCLIIRWSGSETLEIVQCKKHNYERPQGSLIHFDIDGAVYEKYVGDIGI